jgi:hypothetical protein
VLRILDDVAAFPECDKQSKKGLSPPLGPFSRSRKQLGDNRRELHVGSGVMQFQPTARDGELQAGAVFRGRALRRTRRGR